MDNDYTDMPNLFLTDEEQNVFIGSSWIEEPVLPDKDNNMAACDVQRDIQALFNGEAHPEVESNADDDDDDDDTASESESWCWSPPEAKEISDYEIKSLGVKELNKLLRNIPSDEAAKIRRRRRNLKNRSYALTCRLRKQQEHEDLINENTLLKKQLEDGKWKLFKVLNEMEAYKRKYLQAQQAFTTYKQMMEASEVPPCR